MKTSRFALILALTVASAGAWAKLPPPSEEAKAKAEEAKAKAAETAKVEAELLGKAQDRVADAYIKEQKGKGVIVKPTPIVPTTVQELPMLAETMPQIAQAVT